MAGHRIFTTSFASIYPHYVHKAERKGRSKLVDEVARGKKMTSILRAPAQPTPDRG